MLAMLEMSFESTADWREDIAQRYPYDIRSADAAQTFKRLAKTVKDVSQERAERYEALWGAAGHQASQEQSSMLRSVNPWWSTADQFIDDLVVRVRRVRILRRRGESST